MRPYTEINKKLQEQYITLHDPKTPKKTQNTYMSQMNKLFKIYFS